MTTAREEEVGKDAIGTINMRRRAKNMTVGRVSGSMREYYTEVRLFCKLLLVHSRALYPLRNLKENEVGLTVME